MIEIKAMYVWVKNHATVVFSGIGLLLGVIAMMLSRENNIISPKTILRIKKNAKDIAEKEAAVETYENAAEDKREAVEKLKTEIEASKRQVAKDLHGPIVADMDDSQIADLYRKSGL